MPSPFSETLREWQAFYFMLGGASATLIGLIFVAVSLGSSLVSSETRADIDAFVSPVLLYFLSVLIMACVMLVPASSPSFVAVCLLPLGIFGLGLVSWVMLRMVRAAQRLLFGPSQWFWHASLPLISYGLIVAMAVWLAVSGATAVLLGLALAAVLLVIGGIWRTWDLVLWIAHQRVD
jgi:hypothetical protein